jgi:hypothetical protein
MSNQLYILNVDNSINWERYKEYTEHYHNQHCPLSEPYTEEELRTICVEKQIELPEELFNYLTKVSNIIYIEEGYLSSTVFDLRDLPCKEDREKIFIPLDKNNVWNKEYYYNENKGARDSFLEKSRAKNKGFKGAEAPLAEALAFEEYIITNFDKRYMYNIDNLEDEGNYPVDSATEKHNEEMRKMITETIDKVYAEYLEKHKDSIYIYYPKQEAEDWKTLADGEDWTY